MADSFLLELSTTVENIDVNVALVSAESTLIEYFFPQGPPGPAVTPGINTWGSILGTLSAQTDLWGELSAKAQNTDLLDVSGQVVDLETFIASVSSTWTGGQEALTAIVSNSANWNFGYDVATYVQANSANWEESSEIIPTVTNYLSTVPVTLSSIDVKGPLLSAGTDLFDIFLTSETDSQTLSYVPTSYDLSISNGNTVNLSSINTTFAANSGKYENVYSNVQSNSANWNTAFNRSTVFSSVSSRYNSTSTAVESNSANWNNTYNTGTVYQANSSSYATYNFVNSNFLNLTGGTIEGNLTLSGNLYIAGSAAIINATDLVITDPLIFLAEGNSSDLLDIGFTGAYNFDGDPHEHTGLVRSHNTKKWTLFSGLTTELLSALTINFNDPSLQIDTLRANLEGNVVGGTVQGATLSSTGLVYAQGGNSNNWNTAFDRSTQYQNVSGSFATNSTVNSVSSQLVLNTDFNSYKTNVASATATLTPLTLTDTLTSDLLEYIKLLAPPPTYTSPTASISNFSPSNVEIGEIVNRTLTLNWTQNDAGSRGTWRLNKNGIEITSSSDSFPATYLVNEAAVLSTTTYQLSVNFDTGLVKNNSLGFADNRGQILAGSVTSSSSYTGFYRRWIGSNATFPATPPSIRTLGLATSLDTNNNFSPNLPILINNRFILIVIPNTKTLTTVITENNENLTTQFSLSSIQIPDAGNTLREYKLYYLETAVPLNANLTTVTIN